MSLEILNPNLENSPNSTLEFGDFSKVREIFLLNLSLENSPNSTSEFWIFFSSLFCKKNEFGDFELEFGEFSKLRNKRKISQIFF